MGLILPGYTGTVWTAAKSAVAYAAANLNSKSTSQAQSLATATAATLKNAGSAIAAYIAYQGLQQLYANLAAVIPLPLNVPVATYAFLSARTAAIQSAALAIENILPAPGIVSVQLGNNNPVIADPGYGGWLLAFAFETPPTGLYPSTFVDQVQACATAWTTIATAMRQQSQAYSGAAYNTVVLMGNVSQVVASMVANAILPSSISATAVWNQMVAMPSILRAVSAVMNDPTSQTAQGTAIARFVIQSSLLDFNQLLVSLRDTVPAQALRVGTIRQGDSLMTFSNRELGNFELWTQIAQLNGLLPPYVSATPLGPNVASPGQQLFLPPLSGAVSQATVAQVGQPVASYVNNYLGVDIYLGPLNAAMLPWTGDYQIISGYSNLSISLGRRLQTTLGTLMYHPLYGCRIPPLIGSIDGSNALKRIEQYAISCLLSDPRVNKVTICEATQGPNYSIKLYAVVLPNGLWQEDISVNVVLGPA